MLSIKLKSYGIHPTAEHDERGKLKHAARHAVNLNKCAPGDASRHPKLHLHVCILLLYMCR